MTELFFLLFLIQISIEDISGSRNIKFGTNLRIIEIIIFYQKICLM